MTITSATKPVAKLLLTPVDWYSVLPAAEGHVNDTPLPQAPRGSAADQCNAMGLKVGDVIVGRESGGAMWWSEVELTLIWLGDTTAVWGVRRRTIRLPEWHEEGEASNWLLSCRKWYRVTKETSK